MFKGLLLTLILLACTCMGRMLSNVRRRRFEILNDLLAAIRVLRLRILNSMEPLGILLRKADCELFKRLGDSLWEGAGLSESWLQMREEEMRRGGLLTGLNNSDMRILDEFFLSLGKSGRDEQCELFSSVIDRMEDAQQEARQGYMEATKLYTTLGTLVGIGICVLII